MKNYTKEELDNVNQLIESDEYENFLLACDIIGLAYVQNRYMRAWKANHEMQLKAYCYKDKPRVLSNSNRYKKEFPKRYITRKHVGKDKDYEYSQVFKFQFGIVNMTLEKDYCFKQGRFLNSNLRYKGFIKEHVLWSADLSTEKAELFTPKQILFWILNNASRDRNKIIKDE